MKKTAKRVAKRVLPAPVIDRIRQARATEKGSAQPQTEAAPSSRPATATRKNPVAEYRAADRRLAHHLQRRLSRPALAKADAEYLQQKVQPALNEATPFHISHSILRRMERRGLSLRKGLSFRVNMLEMSEARNLGILRPSWALDTKNSAYTFLDQLGVRRPQSDDQTYRFSDIEERSPIVVKATRSTGARGCYLVFSLDNIVHVRDHKTFSSWSEMADHANSLMNPASSAVPALPDRWMVEELILEDSANGVAARNLKFYCFYGTILFIQESRREPDLEVCFYTPDNEQIKTGRYEDLVFDGVGVSPEHVEIVSRISREIPFPFMRIDMLNGENELVFGEFTPRPGNFDELNSYWDRRMGEEWVRAESKILEDLLRGKTFDAYLSSTKLLDRRPK